ncbi:HTH-type transcriptional regulator ArgP [Alteromonas sp. I4]|nr:HTH-type transcriptional regulator ArgP [Alteromonas sp. I4]
MNNIPYTCIKLMIDYAQLHALSAVINEGGFERAARKLFITQSAVSRRIQQLESQLGEPVLLRQQPPKPTATGTRLLNHLQQVLQLEYGLGINALQFDSDPQKPLIVRLAANSDSIATWLPEALVTANNEINARLQFEIVLQDQTVVLNRMKSGEVMVCIASTAEPVNGGLVSYLGALRYRAVASPAFVAAHGIQSVADLADAPCLVFDEHDKLQHEFLTDIVKAKPKRIHLCPSSEGFRQSVVAGLGYGLLPELQIGDGIARGEMVDLAPHYTLDTPLYWHYWQTESPLLASLRVHALNVAKRRLIQPGVS